jgi:peptidoglycan DL-endopeptidase CwlO
MCTWNFRRHAARLGISASLLATSLGIAASPASADQLSTLKAEAQDVANQITTLGNKEEALSEQYDAANVTLSRDRKLVAAATKALDAANTSEAKAKRVLTNEAVNAYMHNGTAGASAVGDNTLQNVNNSLLRAEYASSLAANETDAQDAFRLASLKAGTAKQGLEEARTTAEKQVTTLAAARTQVIAAQTRLEGVYHQETGQVATLVAQIQAQQEATAQAAADAQTQAQQEATPEAEGQAQTADAVSPGTTAASPTTTGSTTTSSSTTTPSTSTTTAPSALPASSVGAGAVAAAETQLGVPYEWGGDTPGVGFDCSGLVMWAYAQVGVSLPHFSGAQFDAGVQIPMSDLEPGDLVFFANPADHVAMYVGNGNIIEAPTYGQVVHIVPMYSEFVQAVRIS